MNSQRAAVSWPIRAGAMVATLLVAAALAPVADALPTVGRGAPATAGPSTAGYRASATIPGPVGPAEPTVEIHITSFEPAAPQPGDVLVIEGTVTNITDEPMVFVQALLRHNLNPLGSRADLESVDASPRLVWGSRPGHVFAEVADSLAAGGSAGFRLEVQLETACPLPVPGATPCVQIQHPGVYVFGVDVREGNPNLPGARVDAGTTLSLLPWLIDAERSVEVAMLWPVTGSPAIRPDGTLGDVDTSAMVGPAGWLSTLLDAPEGAPVSWVVDPDVLDTVAEIADSDDPRARSAANWMATFESTAANAHVLLLPFALPDVAAFDGPDQARLAGAAVRRSAIAAQQLRTGTRTIAWPLSAADVEDELAAYRQAGVTTAVVSSQTVAAGGRPWADLPAGNSTISGLVADAALSSTISLVGDQVALRQRWLASTALAVLDAGERSPAPLVVSPPLDWRPSRQAATRLIDVWTAAPWVEPVGLGEIDGERGPGTLLPADAPPAAETSPTADAAADLLAAVAQYETLLAEPADSEDFSAVMVRAAAAAWRADPDTGRQYISTAAREVRELLSQVSLQVASTVTLSSNTGAFPVNVMNHLDVPVMVRLELESANPQRMSVEPVTAQRIEPGETEILRVTAEAVANGKVRVELQLATVDGTPLGRATQTVVNATDYGVIGWFLIVGAGLLFVAALAVRTIRGKRRNGTPASSDLEPSDHAPLEGASR